MLDYIININNFMNVSMPSVLSLLVFFCIVGVAVHEVGHLVFGLLTGYKFGFLRVLIFVWYKEHDKIKFTVSLKMMKVALGQCLMIPPENEKDFKFVLYNLGGDIFNGLLLIILVMLRIAFPYSGIIWGAVSAVLLLLIVSLVPIFQGDGKNILTALKSKDAKHGMYLCFYVYSETMNGKKRYSELNSELFSVSDTADFNNYFVSYIVIYEAARLYDLGEYHKSIACYEKLKNAKPFIYSNAIKSDYLYYYTVHKPDYEKAQELFADKKLQKHLINQPRILAAYEYFVNDNKDKGRELLKKAKNEAKQIFNSGLRLMEMDYCAKLEEMFA